MVNNFTKIIFTVLTAIKDLINFYVLYLFTTFSTLGDAVYINHHRNTT